MSTLPLDTPFGMEELVLNEPLLQISLCGNDGDVAAEAAVAGDAWNQFRLSALRQRGEHFVWRRRAEDGDKGECHGSRRAADGGTAQACRLLHGYFVSLSIWFVN